MTESPTTDGSRRSILLGIKLRALVGDHVGQPVESDVDEFARGAGLMLGTTAWVLVDGDAAASFGAALAWAIRRGASSLEVIAETGGGVVARRAEGFSLPVTVWFPLDRALLPTVAEPLAAPPQPDADHLGLCPMITEAGAVPNVEHGVVCGEVRGLEVCRVVGEPTVGFFSEFSDIIEVTERERQRRGDSALRLEVGVGAADREAFQMLHGDLPTIEALTNVVAAVASHRKADARVHPLNRLGRERFLRWEAQQAPESVGLVELAPAEPPVARQNLKDPVPCVASGVDAAGDGVAVVFSSGVDLELLPYVVDVQATTSARVVVALPERDLVELTRDLAALLVTPIDFVVLPASAG